MSEPSDFQRVASSATARREVAVAMDNVSVVFESYFNSPLTDATLKIYRGEIFALIGPAKSGKSTTLRILAGRLRPTMGKVKIFRRSPRRARKRVGYLPEKPEHNRSGALNALLHFFDSIVPRKRKSDREKSVRRLSQVVLGNRDLILLDEPFSGLNPEEILEARNLIRSLAEGGKTIIFSSDSLVEAKTLCNRMAIYYAGKIQATGTLEELLAQPDAVRFLAPVLPEEISKRVLEKLREELGSKIVSVFAKPDSNAIPAKNESSIPVSNEKLANLVKTTDSKPATTKTSPSSQPGKTDSVDHDKLAELTRPPENV